jgi:hypothetical protein
MLFMGHQNTPKVANMKLQLAIHHTSFYLPRCERAQKVLLRNFLQDANLSSTIYGSWRIFHTKKAARCAL